MPRPAPGDELELARAQHVEPEASGLEDQVVTEVELVDVDRKAGDRGHDRGAHGRVRDHAVALAAALRGERDHGRGEGPQKLVDLVRLHRACPGMTATLSLYHGQPPRPLPRPPPARPAPRAPGDGDRGRLGRYRLGRAVGLAASCGRRAGARARRGPRGPRNSRGEWGRGEVGGWAGRALWTPVRAG